MGDKMGIRFCLTGLALLVAASAGPAQAADPGTDAEALITSAQTLIQRLDATGAKGTPPTLRNGDAALVRTAYDANVVRAMPLDLDKVSRACIAVGNSIVSYVNFAERSANGAADRTAASEAKLSELQDEIIAGSIAANLCVQKGFRAVAGVVAKMTPEQRVNVREPMAQMRDGGSLTIASSISSATASNVSLANRAKLLSAVIEDLRFTADSLTPADRRSLRDKVVAVIPELPPTLAKQANDIAAVLAGTDCNLLCQVGS